MLQECHISHSIVTDGEQDGSGIFPAKERAHSPFAGATEEHCRTSVLFLPPIKISMPIPPRAGEVLADLGVAVRHQATLRVVQICGGEFFPTTSGGKSIEPEQGSAVKEDVADFDDTLQTLELASTSSRPSSSVS
jgi:hypothetical protein